MSALQANSTSEKAKKLETPPFKHLMLVEKRTERQTSLSRTPRNRAMIATPLQLFKKRMAKKERKTAQKKKHDQM